MPDENETSAQPAADAGNDEGRSAESAPVGEDAEGLKPVGDADQDSETQLNKITAHEREIALRDIDKERASQGQNETTQQRRLPDEDQAASPFDMQPRVGYPVLLRGHCVDENERQYDAAAVITRVNDDGTLNLTVFPDRGAPFPRTNVKKANRRGPVCESWLFL